MNKYLKECGFVFLFFWASNCFAILGSGLPDFTKLVEKASPAVVNISTIKVVETSERLKRFFNPFKEFPPFDDFFKKFFEELPKKQKEHALGSGFIISKDGYIVTNYHVISKANQIKVILEGGKESYKAKVIGTDPETDLALLKINTKRYLPYLKFGDSDKIKTGEWVIAIGNPFGLDHTVTAGIISAKGRIIGAGPYDNFLQTDASINPGNSGGPLLNMEGEVIGINTAIVASGQGIGFAIPSNMAKNVIEQLKKYGKPKRGWLGVTIQDVDNKTAKALGLPKPYGALVASVIEGEPADKAGIKSGDVIIAVNDHTIKNGRDLTRVIGRFLPGKKVKITLWHRGKIKEVWVKLGERSINISKIKSHRPSEHGYVPGNWILGMSLKKISSKEAEALGLKKAIGLIVVDVKENSKAAYSDIRVGDVILQANGTPVNSVEEFKRIVQKDAHKKGVLLLLIKRKGRNLFRTIVIKNEK